MSQIDLKLAHIYLIDGYTSTAGNGLINLLAGYSIGATTLTVDGFTGAVNTGDTIMLGSDPNVYTITAHTETSSATTSITISPGLIVAAVDDTAITIQPHQLEVKIGAGTLTYDEKRKIDYIMERGLLGTVRLGDQEPMDIRFDILWDFLRSPVSSPPTIEEALKQIGNASSWVTSSPDTCEPYCVDIKVVYTPSCYPTIEKEIYLIQQFRWESLAHDFKAGTVAVTGKCNKLTASVSRAA